MNPPGGDESASHIADTVSALLTPHREETRVLPTSLTLLALLTHFDLN